MIGVKMAESAPFETHHEIAARQNQSELTMPIGNENSPTASRLVASSQVTE